MSGRSKSRKGKVRHEVPYFSLFLSLGYECIFAQTKTRLSGKENEGLIFSISMWVISCKYATGSKTKKYYRICWLECHSIIHYLSNVITPQNIIRTTEWGILFNQNPLRNHQAGFCHGGFWGGSGWTEYRTSVVFVFYPVISWIHIFMGNYSCFQIAIYLRFSTSNLLCLNVHLNCLFLINHLVYKQPQWQSQMTMT